ncbi:MAG: cytochrome d ubiquinol oxidase subunit II [Kineosporiaceae bacterium]
MNDISALQMLWFGLVAVLFAGYLILEGFDFGVGMLLPILGKNDTERRVMINTIGPVWDGNEVWLITAGGALFAAFPFWYATLFSAFYLPLFLILIALIMRGVAFEYRGKRESTAWRGMWDAAIVTGSLLPSLLWGVAFGNLIRGIGSDVLIDKGVVASKLFALTPTADGAAPSGLGAKAGDQWFEIVGVNMVPNTMGEAHTLVAHPTFNVLIAALNPFSLLMGVVTLVLFLTHGALYVGMKTTGELRERALAKAFQLSLVLLLAGAAWAVWYQLSYGKAWTWAMVVIAAAALVGIVYAAKAGKEALGFMFSAVTAVSAVVMTFGAMYPNVIPIHLSASTLESALADPAVQEVTPAVQQLTAGADISALVRTSIATASSTELTLTVMTWVAGIFVPIVLAYSAWTYWVFRKRISTSDIPAGAH